MLRIYFKEDDDESTNEAEDYRKGAFEWTEEDFKKAMERLNK